MELETKSTVIMRACVYSRVCREQQLINRTAVSVRCSVWYLLLRYARQPNSRFHDWGRFFHKIVHEKQPHPVAKSVIFSKFLLETFRMRRMSVRVLYGQVYYAQNTVVNGC